MNITTELPRYDIRSKDFAAMLGPGVNERTVADWRRAGIGPEWIRMPGGRGIRYSRASVEEFLEERRRAPMETYSPIPQRAQPKGDAMPEGDRTPTPAQRTAAQRRVLEFVAALSRKAFAEADRLIPATAANVVALEAAGLVIRALRMTDDPKASFEELRGAVLGQGD